MRSQAASVTLGMRWIKGRRIGMASWPRRRGEVRWRADMDPVIDAEGRSCQQKHQGQNPLGFVEPCKDHTAISVAIATCLSCSYQEQVQHHPSIGPHVHRQHTFPHIAARVSADYHLQGHLQFLHVGSQVSTFGSLRPDPPCPQYPQGQRQLLCNGCEECCAS